nr:hypothetical protein [Candidatus Hydrogenedentota bacterium]
LLLAAQLKTRSITHDIILHTIEKTTVPDPDKRARVAAAVMEGTQTPAVPERTVETMGSNVDKTQRDQLTREQRATDILLRAVRSRQG